MRRILHNVWLDIRDHMDRRVTVRYWQFWAITGTIIVLSELPSWLFGWIILAYLGVCVATWLVAKWMGSRTRQRWQERSHG